MITHDRYLLDQVSTSVLGLGLPLGNPLFASYDQWTLAAKESAPRKERKAPIERPKRKKGLSCNEKRELAQIEERIEKAETELEEAQLAIEGTSDLQKACRTLEKAQSRSRSPLHQMGGARETAVTQPRLQS